MTVAQYIVDELIKYGAKDAFGIPGGVVLRLLYAMEDRKETFTPHLNYHEQMAGFAACGYGQASGELGVAYATRGPGISNMITCITEAYQESIPVVFITAHGIRTESKIRFENNQEVNFAKVVTEFTKFSANIETLDDVENVFNKACEIAISGRKGPVFLDFSSKLFEMKIEPQKEKREIVLIDKFYEKEQSDAAIEEIRKRILEVRRPLILIGDGVRQVKSRNTVTKILNSLKIPVLSSRGSQDIASESEYYYGYIGSHGTRYSNFILSKADLIIAVGNRLAYPVNSESFSPITKNATIIRLDIDKNEFCREIPDSVNYQVDVKILAEKLQHHRVNIKSNDKWICICNFMKEKLEEFDLTEPVIKLENYLKGLIDSKTFVCDVGNSEFWFARAYERVRPKGVVLYSKSYGTLGAALGRAIGAYYATRKEVICVIGDQGFQYNIQELQYIVQWNLPIKIILMNNSCSGMIFDHERMLYGEKFLHVSKKTGYSVPDFKKIALSYGINYTQDKEVAFKKTEKPLLFEIKYDAEILLVPNLPRGHECQNMVPDIEKKLYHDLCKL